MLSTLLIGREHLLAWALPQMLARAGFFVDVITSAPFMQKGHFVRHCTIVPEKDSLIPFAVEKLKNNYNWIIVTDDGTLKEIVSSNLTAEDKLKLLPVMKEEDFSHIHSKIGLFQLFSSRGIKTPDSFIGESVAHAKESADKLGFPVLLKVDASGGGYGVYECETSSDIDKVPSKVFKKPFLVQKKIDGEELDLSALCLEGNLIHFSYSKIKKRCGNKFGISSLRTYSSLLQVPEEIFRELQEIGKVIGAHGFVNIACIESKEGRYYFEADMRPNVWVEFPRFLGEDPAIRIRQWFQEKKVLTKENHVSKSISISIPYFLRLNLLEFLVNRYNVWKYLPYDDKKLLCRLIFNQMVCTFFAKLLFALVRPLITRRFYKRLNSNLHRYFSFN